MAPDPRVTLPPEAYAQQFALARRIEEAQGRVAAAARENGALLTALAERRKGASPETVEAIDALAASAPRRSPGGSAWWLPPTVAHHPARRGRRLGKLATAVDGADAAPSPDVVAGFEKIQPALDRHPRGLGRR